MCETSSSMFPKLPMFEYWWPLRRQPISIFLVRAVGHTIKGRDIDGAVQWALTDVCTGVKQSITHIKLQSISITLRSFLVPHSSQYLPSSLKHRPSFVLISATID